MTRALRISIGIAIAALFVWLLLRQVRIGELRAALAGARPGWVVLATGLFLLGYACRIERWRLMLGHDNAAIEWSRCAGPLMASVAANNLLPLRAGDVMRALGFNRRLGTTATTAVASLLLERILDVLMLAIFLGIALLVFGVKWTPLAGTAGLVLVMGALVGSAFVLRPRWFQPTVQRALRVLRPLSMRLATRADAASEQIFAALAHAAGGSVMPRLLSWTVLAWALEGSVFWCTARAIPSLVAPVAAWLALPVASLGTAIPGTPGFVGTFDLPAASAMMSLGNGASSAAAFALLVHAVIWLPPVLIGGVYLFFHPPVPANAQEKAAP